MLYFSLFCIAIVIAEQSNHSLSTVAPALTEQIKLYNSNQTSNDIMHIINFLLFELKIFEYTIELSEPNNCIICTILPFVNNSHQCNNIACNNTLILSGKYKYYDNDCNDFCKFFSLMARLLFYIFVFVINSSFNNIVTNYLLYVIIVHIYGIFSPFICIALLWYN